MTLLPKIPANPLDDEFQSWMGSLSPGTQDVTKRLVTASKAEAADVTLGWFVLELVGDDQPEMLPFDSYEALVGHVRQRSTEESVRMFCFWGAPIRLTKGNFKFIVLPNGERTPLFHIPDEEEMEFDDEGRFTDISDAPIGEVTELNVGGSSIPLSSDGGEDTVDYPAGDDFDEYDEVDDEDDYDEEESAAEDAAGESEDYDESDEEYEESGEEDVDE